MSHRLLGFAAAVCFILTASVASADVSCGCGQVASPCGDPCASSCGDPCGCGSVQSGCCGSTIQMQSRTIYVNQMVTEMRTVTRTKCKMEKRSREITVMKRVPVTEEKTRKYTVMVPTKKTRQVEYQVCVPYTEQKEKF